MLAYSHLTTSLHAPALKLVLPAPVFIRVHSLSPGRTPQQRPRQEQRVELPLDAEHGIVEDVQRTVLAGTAK